MSRFWIIVGIFFAYTSYKAAQLSNGPASVAMLGTAMLFVLMLSSMFIYRSHESVFDEWWFRALAWTGSLTMAVWATFILLSIPVDILSVVVSIPRKINPGLAIASTLLVAAGFVQASLGARIKSVQIEVPNLPSAFHGLKIVQVSDLHVGATLRKNYVGRVVEKINATKPDLVLLTGDVADGHATSIAEHLEPLRRLKPRYGAFYVTGNHEYYWGVNDLVAQIKGLGFTPLLNENKIITINERPLMIAGVTDPAGEIINGHTPDIVRAGTSASSPELKILLAHRPGAYEQAEPLGFDLQFSGHTHSGQFFPFNLLIGFFHKYSRGLYRHGRLWLYVNPGTGYWGPPSRLGVVPEITLATLK